MEEINKCMLFYIDELLTQQYGEFYRYELFNDDIIEVYAFNKLDEKDKTSIIKIAINHNYQQVYIPNIFMPQGLKYQGMGKKMIFLVYSIARNFEYETFVTQLVDSFRERLLRRGAVKTNHFDILKITENTNLLNPN